jgi:predicted dehydrogenase
MTPPARPSVALDGAGMIAMAHAASARHLGMDLTAVASRTSARAEKIAGTFGSVATTYDWLPGGADIVVVATPPQCHAEDTIRLLDAGAAVLVEKPLCRTLEEADRMVEAAARHGGRLLYCENLAYAPVITTMVALAGRVGTPTDLEVRSLQGLPTWGAFTTDEWGGGALFDLGVHPLALAMRPRPGRGGVRDAPGRCRPPQR